MPDNFSNPKFLKDMSNPAVSHFTAQLEVSLSGMDFQNSTLEK